MSKVYSRVFGAIAPVFLLAGFVGSASADQILNFSYTDLEGDTIAGTMNGVLQADDNTFLVTSMGPLTLDGSPTIALSSVESLDFESGSGNGYGGLDQGAVTLNGSYFDIIACDTGACEQGFLLAQGDAFAITIGQSLFSSSADFDNTEEAINPDGWSASPVPTTPEPQPWALMSIALGAVAVRKRLAKSVE
jgi:hypothetical protein